MRPWNPWTYPNALTLIRFGIGFWCVIIVTINFFDSSAIDLKELQWWAFGLVCFAFITDWLDGYIARKFPGQQSRLGAYIDPPADKLAVVGYMLYLYVLGSASGWIEIVCFSLIFGREVGMMYWRMKGGADFFPVNWIGKWKTGFQMVALLAYGMIPLFPDLYIFAPLLLVMATVFTSYSLIVYVVRGPQRQFVAPPT